MTTSNTGTSRARLDILISPPSFLNYAFASLT